MNEPQPVLERDWRPFGGAGPEWAPEWDGIERFDAAETPFYGSSVAEGICPDLHEPDADQHDVVARRLIPGRGKDGTWSQCEECGALWRLRAAPAEVRTR